MEDAIKLKKLTFRQIASQVQAAPNLITLSRILFLPIVVYFIREGHHICSVISLFFLWITDLIDGIVARAFKKRTDLGLLLDPLADKITVAVLFIALYLYEDFPLWVGILIIARDLVILVASYILLKYDRIFSSGWWGRVTTVTLAIITILYIIDEQRFVYSRPIALGLCYALIPLTALTLGDYWRRFVNSFKDKP
jgi:CDP-diacylglycerol--glycerol-3-phosphate 3-phosphatidyltransferase